MNTKTNHSIVTRSEWLAARNELLAEEKRLTRQMDAVSAKRRALPWVKIDKDYQFESRKGRAQPVGHPAFHARPGLGRRMPELLLHG